MEPPAGAGGRRSRGPPRAYPSAGFNGATSRSWWKVATHKSHVLDPKAASMEPPAGAGGRCTDARTSDRSAKQLQWSHQPELVEGSSVAARRPADPCGRFNGATSRSWWKASHAVVRPCFCADGFNGATSRSWWKEEGDGFVDDDAAAASMEPPAGAGGRKTAGRGVVEYRVTLQWSHQPELVEGRDTPPVQIDHLGALQWSHQPELVEGAYLPRITRGD